MVDNVKYLVKPSKPDSRDHAYKKESSTIKESIDLREWDSAVEDQNKLGSCVANAIANAYELMTKQIAPEKFVDLSRLYIYYNSRVIENTVGEDTGVYIRDGLKAVKFYGACREDLWPYDIKKFNQQPPAVCYVDATKRNISEYKSLFSLGDMLEVLSNNKPVIIGMAVYSSFDLVNKENPVIPLPTPLDPYIGGHAVSIVGYDLSKHQFLIKNSYGTDWGDGGYGWLPFEYVRTEGFEKWCFDIALN